MSEKPLRTLLIELDSSGSHIAYNTLTKLASMSDGDSAADLRIGIPVSHEDLLTLFEKGWIAKYDSRDGESLYRITESGRAAIN
jgi:hypothetical protein